MIGPMIRRARVARARKKIEQLHERFRSEPDVQFVSHVAAVFRDDDSVRILAKSIREGCEGALVDMGLVGPWADQERRSMAILSMMSLLADVVPDNVLELAFSDEPLGEADV